MKRNKLLALILSAVLMALPFAGCGKKNEGNRIDQIKERGYLTVATEPYFAPYEFIDSSKEGDEKYVGADIELAKYIADQLGVDLKIVPLEFSGVLSSVAEGKYDLALSCLAYTPARAAAFDFTDYYYNSGDSKGYSILVREEDYNKYNSFDDFDGKKVVCQAGSLQEAYANEQMDPDSFKEFIKVSSTTDGYLMVSEGKADACVCSVDNAELYIAANPGLITLADKMLFEVDPEYVGVRGGIAKGNEEFLEFVNQCIAQVKEDGSMAKWVEEYTEYASNLGL